MIFGAVNYHRVEMRRTCLLRGPASVLVVCCLLGGNTDHLLQVIEEALVGRHGVLGKSVSTSMPK